MRLLLLAIPSLLLASCQSMSEGVLAFEARAVVIDDADIDDVESGSAFEEENIDISSYGVHAALKTPVVDLLVGVDDREFGRESSAELVLGVRRRFLEIWKLHPYLEADYRHGFDLDNGVDSETYDGWAAGGGALLHLTDSLFLNFRLMYETTSIQLPSISTDVDGVTGTVGIGFSL